MHFSQVENLGRYYKTGADNSLEFLSYPMHKKLMVAYLALLLHWL